MADQKHHRPNQQSQTDDLHDPSGEMGPARGRSNRERASSADDRAMDESQRPQTGDELDAGMESDLDDARDVDEETKNKEQRTKNEKNKNKNRTTRN